ncbi:MAG: sugar ABC transporter substrate-binding protein [Butyricicoccus sp.]|nr:sugar ABC transporter substrate-binding protein [Butyricicoccus sp.]
MNRRMIAAALACLACTAGLSACSLTGTGDTHHIAVIIKHAGEHFQNVMAGAEACASEHPNVTIDIQFPSSADYSAEQLDLFRSALDDDSVDAVVISPMQSGQLSAAAESTDKPIIALDTDFTSDKKLSFVGTGNEAAAKSGGLAAMKKAKSNGADKPQAVILTGAQGDETHEARLRGYRSAVEQAGGTVLEVQYCDAQPDRAAAAMEAVMQKYPQGVDALLVTSDDMALVAIKCIWDNNSAAYQKTVICGFDGNQAAVEALDRGELTVDIAQQGYEMGYKAVEAALDALEGKSVESVIDSGSEVITADNIDAYIADCREKGLWS